jgi:endonuclease/exonuclease/phosphatase family metal-dependent hydrolase
VRLLTWNVGLLPRWIGPRSDAARADRIAALLQEIDVDVVVLQEVFNTRIRDRLVASLSPHFSSIIASAGSGWPFASSGLFLATHRRILQHAFAPFPDADRWTTDWLARKGVLGAEIEGFGWIFTTHLQAGILARHGVRGYRGRQVETLRAFIEERADTWALGGDFNLIAEVGGVPTDDWLGFEAALPATDAWRAVHPSDPGFTWDGVRNPTIPARHRTRERLDGWRLRGHRATAASLVDPPLSDHFGVVVTVEPTTTPAPRSS